MWLAPFSSQNLERSYICNPGGEVGKLWAVPFSGPEQKDTHCGSFRGRCQQHSHFLFYFNLLFFCFIKKQNETQNVTFHIAKPFQNHQTADPTVVQQLCVSFLSLVLFPLIDHKKKKIGQSQRNSQRTQGSNPIQLSA